MDRMILSSVSRTSIALLIILFCYHLPHTIDYCMLQNSHSSCPPLSLPPTQAYDGSNDDTRWPPPPKCVPHNESYFPFNNKLTAWYNEARKEVNLTELEFEVIAGDYIVYPTRFYQRVADEYLTKNNKSYDFCFIGSLTIDLGTTINRRWILPFVAKHFTNESFLQFTDNKTKAHYVPKGPFDHTLTRPGYVPKRIKQEFKINYFDPSYVL